MSSSSSPPPKLQFRMILQLLLSAVLCSAWLQTPHPKSIMIHFETDRVRRQSSSTTSKGIFPLCETTTTSLASNSNNNDNHATENENDNNNNIQRNTNNNDKNHIPTTTSRRALLSSAAATVTASMMLSSSSSSSLTSPFSILSPLPAAHAIGPVKITLEDPIIYTAKICPKDRPIPGEKAMKGMRGLCVTVQANLAERTEKPLSKVGVYGFITDAESGESVLANNPDLGSDAGQFAMIETVDPDDTKVVFEFIAAVPMDKNISKYDNGIGSLSFEGLRIISFPGGQQFGAISPCEMNEFSDECEAWEAENGPFQRGEYMIRQNSRTKGR